MGRTTTTPYQLVEHLTPSLTLPVSGRPYPLETAVAETVSACAGTGAGEIHVGVEFAGPTSWIRILADGAGLDDAALRAPDNPPVFDRAPGVRGVGLVAAGLAHCDGLTIASARRGGAHIHRWKSPLSAPLSSLVHSDLDLVLEPLASGASTVVLWEGLVEVQRYQRREGRAAEHGLDRLRAHIAAGLGSVLHRALERGVAVTVSNEPVRSLPPQLGAVVARYPALLVCDGAAVELTTSVQRGVQGGVDGFLVYAGDVLAQAGGWNRLAVPPAGRGTGSVRVDVPPRAEAAFARNLISGKVVFPEALVPTLKALAVMAQDLGDRSDAA